MLAGRASARASLNAAQKTVVLAGNPNAGKTTLFNALTKSRLKTGNFHGVTTAVASKTVRGITYKDVPGTYSLSSYTMEEREAIEAAKTADVIINVVDATTLEHSLNLTRRLISLNENTVVYLTKTDVLTRRGGKVNAQNLAAVLGVPVLDCPPKKLKTLVEEGGFVPPKKDGGMTLAEAYYGGNCNLSRAEKLFYNKFFALAFFIAALTFTFFFTFHPSMPGAFLKGKCEWLFVDLLSSVAQSKIGNPALASFLCEGVLGGVGGVLSFIPQITVLYLTLTVLDESGISSALTFVTDGLFEKAGLSGRAAFSLISGFGCTAAAISTTRGYAEEDARRKTIAVLPFIPCGAKMPVFLTFLSPLFKNPFPAICLLYFGGIALAVAVSAILKGKSEGLISEVTPISVPRAKEVAKKLFFQVQSFIIKVTTYVFVFCALSWILSHVSFSKGLCAPQESILGAFSRFVAYLFYPMGVRDWRVAYAALTGFAAKENIAATVALLIPEGLSLGLAPSVALCVFFLVCPACISAFASSVKEIGFARTLKYNLAQLVFAFVSAYLTYFIISLL